MRKLVMLLLGVLLCYGQLLAQNRVITGKVLDANGNPVPNASILIKGTSTGTSSGMDGSFSISVPPNAQCWLFLLLDCRTGKYLFLPISKLYQFP